MTQKFLVTALETHSSLGIVEGNTYTVTQYPDFPELWRIDDRLPGVIKCRFGDPMPLPPEQKQGDRTHPNAVKILCVETANFLLEKTGGELRLETKGVETKGVETIDFPTADLDELLLLLNHAKEHML